MTASGSAKPGQLLNRESISDRLVGDVAAATKLLVGLVYQDGANGFKQAPVDGTIAARALYWNPYEIDNASGSKGDKIGTFYGNCARVVGKADGAIAVNAPCRASETAAHGGQFESLTIRTDSVPNNATDVQALVALYKGHIGETVETANDPTAAVDGEEDLVFEIVRGT